MGMFEEVILHQAYDLKLLHFEPDLILDVGAHIGLFSLCAATRWPKVPIIALEPHPENAIWARRNFLSNNLRGSILEAAASVGPGWFNFELGGGMGRLAGNGASQVIGVDLAAIIQSFPASRLLLKMDIEGGEMTILPKVLPVLPDTTAVFVELHGSRQECEQMLTKIESLGFEITTLRTKQSEERKMSYFDLFLRPR